jgi:hypothetical protein
LQGCGENEQYKQQQWGHLAEWWHSLHSTALDG